MKYLIMVLVLTGCYQEPVIEWSGNITEQSERFILSYDQALYPESQLPKVEQWWVEVQTCVGISIDISGSPLIIEYTPIQELPDEFLGYIIYADRYARVYDWELLYTQGATTKHEMIHYLMHLIGATDNLNHKSWMFDCALAFSGD